jgi:cholesterol transport system auxiliary component
LPDSAVDRRILCRLALALPLAALAGCGGGPPPTTFDLSAARAERAGRVAAGRAVLVVSEPATILAYDSERLVVRTRDNVVTYLGGVQWSDKLPRLLQNRLIQSLENLGRLRSVGRPGDRLVADYVLVGDIRLFEVQENTREAVVELALKLVTERNGNIAAAEVFTARVPVASIDPAGATAGLDAALTAVFRQAARWVGGRV